jgi:hypothetical protein
MLLIHVEFWFSHRSIGIVLASLAEIVLSLRVSSATWWTYNRSMSMSMTRWTISSNTWAISSRFHWWLWSWPVACSKPWWIFFPIKLPIWILLSLIHIALNVILVLFIHARDLFFLHQGIKNWLKIFPTLKGVNCKNSLNCLFILDDVILERPFDSISRIDHKTIAFNIKSKCLRAYQVSILLDPYNWNLDIHIINVFRDVFINFFSLSWLEFKGCLWEQIFNSLSYFIFIKAKLIILSSIKSWINTWLSS